MPAASDGAQRAFCQGQGGLRGGRPAAHCSHPRQHPPGARACGQRPRVPRRRCTASCESLPHVTAICMDHNDSSIRRPAHALNYRSRAGHARAIVEVT